MQRMEELSLKTMKEAQSEYEQRCLETLETALSRTPVYESWKAFDPGRGDGSTPATIPSPRTHQGRYPGPFPHGVVPVGLDLDAALARGEVSFVSTSGTADEALENIWNQQWWNDSERASWKLNGIAARVATGTHREAILASALSVGPRSEKVDPSTESTGCSGGSSSSTSSRPRRNGRRITSAEFLLNSPITSRQVLEANPSLIARLARFAWKTGAAV